MDYYNREQLQKYFSKILGADVKIISISEMGGKDKEKLKKGGHSIHRLIELEFKGFKKKYVIELVAPSQFGHETMPDRAQVALLAHNTYNNLPLHARSLDCGAFMKDGSIVSVGNAEEFFMNIEFIEGPIYKVDLYNISERGNLTELDKQRARRLSDYLVEIHAKKRNEPGLYIKRIRELVGHGECIFGLTDSYPPDFEFASSKRLCEIEKKCVDWRWKLKNYTRRLCQEHGDFHPWNIIFREGTDLSVFDRSRGEWGEAADDVTALTINYIFFSIIKYGRLKGPFEELYNLFFNNYLEKTGDEEILEVLQPFYAWRGLVTANPIWYPNLGEDTRIKLFNFIDNILNTDNFNPKEVNSYLK
jgi:hypothetical protein